MMLYDSHYIDQVIQIIETPLSFEGFEEVMNSVMPVLYHQWNAGSFLNVSSDRYAVLHNALRSKIVDYIKNGHLLDNNYINLFFLFRNCELSNDPDTESLIRLIEPAYEEYGANQKEKFIFAHLLFVLHFLNANGKKGIELFLSEHLFFDGKVYSAMDKDAQKLKEFLIAHSITFEEVANAIALGLEDKSFMARSRSQQLNAVVWILGFFWQINGYENHRAWKDIVYPRLLVLFQLFLKIEDAIEVVMHLHFLMSHIYMNGAQTQDEFRIFNQDVEEAASVCYQEWGKKHFVPEAADGKKSSGKIKIALIKDRIVRNAPSKVEIALLKELLKTESFTQHYEFVIYTLAMVEKSLDDQTLIQEFRDMGIVVKEKAMQVLDYTLTYQSHLSRALAVREDMQYESIDIMIAATNNFPEASFLFSTRSSPKQIFWSHGNFAYDILGIDNRITHSDEARYSEGLKRSGKYFHVFTQVRDLNEMRGNIAPVIIEIERSKYPSDVTILGSIGRMIKLESESYLEAVASILKQNPKSIYLACGSGETGMIREKLEALEIMDRVYFTGHVNPHLYGYLIDIFLNTFPLSSGEALNEYMAKGRIAISIFDSDHPALIELFEKHQEKTYDRLFAYSVDDYIQLANTIIDDRRLQENLKQQIIDHHEMQVVTDNTLAVDTFVRSIKAKEIK